MQMWWQMYGWWSWLTALPAATALGMWLFLSPTAHRVVVRVHPRSRAEYRLAFRRLHGRISTADYQYAMAKLAHQSPQPPFPQPSHHLV